MSVFQAWEKRLLQALDAPLPLVDRPFAAIAQRAGITEEEVIERVRAWIADGTIRRFGARVNHRRIGYTANGMSVWRVPDLEVDSAAAFMSGQPEVSHCYLRPAFPGWDYNLYAMIHGTNRTQVLEVAQRIAKNTGCADYQVLFSVREFKKSAPAYFAEDAHSGEEAG